jgi:hypothetical protein
MRRRGIGIAVGIAAAGLTIGLAGPAGAVPSGSASGIGVNLTTPVGNQAISPTPSVHLPPGGTVSVGSLSVPGVLSAGVLNASSHQTSPTGAASSASVADLNALPGVASLSATVVGSACTADASGTAGNSSIVSGSVAGTPLNVSPSPNTTVTVPGVGSVVLNEQQASAGGITVRAIHARIATLGGVQADIPVAVSVCDSGLGAGGGAGGSAGGVGATRAVRAAPAASASGANPPLTG